MKNRNLLICVLLSSLSFAGCKDGDKHLSQGKMADLMADLQLADAFANNHYEYSSDSARNILRQTVLEKHGVTQAEYDKTMEWYAHNVENYTKLCENVEKQLDKRQKALLASSSENNESKNTGNLWPYSAMAMISPLSTQDALQFSLPVTDLVPGDRLKWRMRLSSPSQSQMVLGVDYTNGTTSYWMRRSSQKIQEITLQTDSALTVNRVYGYIRFDRGVRLPVWADSIELQQLPISKEIYHQIEQQTTYKGPRKKDSTDTIKKRQTIKPITDESVSKMRPGEKVGKSANFNS